MSYASKQFLLLSYKSQKADAEFRLGQVTNKYNAAVRESNDLNEELARAKGQLDSSDDDYLERCRDLDAEYMYGDGGIADLAEEEDKWQQEMSNCNTEIKQLDGYINSWQAALQNDIKNTHTYGANAGG